MSSFMESIENDYCKYLETTNRDRYKIYYSHIHEFPLLILGQNPGGTVGEKYLSASDSYFENWEHDFVEYKDCNQYSLAKPMCSLLYSVLQTKSDDIIRQIPFTNLIFRRSQNTEKLNIGLQKATLETKPYLTRIIEYVNPKIILIISKTAYGLFVKNYCKNGIINESKDKYVLTPNGTSSAKIYSQGIGYVNCLKRDTRLFMIGHPSKYSSRKEWSKVEKYLLDEFVSNNFCPIENKDFLYQKTI